MAVNAGQSFKVVCLGEGRVGKTSIGLRWAEDAFDPATRSTVAAAFFQKTAHTKDGKAVNIQLWDTAGQEEFKSLCPIYYKDAHAALLVYSVIDRSSFQKMIAWRNELSMARGDNIRIVIAANKADRQKERCVSRREGDDYATSVHAQYFEVSAKTGQGIDLLFMYIAEILAAIPVKAPVGKRAGKVSLTVVTGTTEKKKKGCC